MREDTPLRVCQGPCELGPGKAVGVGFSNYRGNLQEVIREGAGPGSWAGLHADLGSVVTAQGNQPRRLRK